MTVSRRALIGGALSSPFLGGSAKAVTQRVVIIGAGAAGLAAAKALRPLGFEPIVIEARDRIGGRAYTDMSLGPRFDAGAYYIHWAERNPWTAIAQELAMTTLDDGSLGNGFRIAEDGRLLERGQAVRRRFAFSTFNQLADNRPLDLPDISLGELAAQFAAPDVIAAARAIASGSLGEEAERVSLTDYQRLDSGHDLVVPAGYGTLVARYGADVPVRLQTPATRVDWSGRGVIVTTPQGNIEADAVIVTVPIGVLHEERIAFHPPLPQEITRAINGLAMGAYTKIALHFERGDGFGLPANATLVSRRGQLAVLYAMWPHDEDVVIGHLGGDRARALAAAGEAAAIDEMLTDLAEALGAQVRSAFRGGRLVSWWQDPWACGSYAIAKPGHAGARLALSEPVGERVFFAGEAVNGKEAMTVGGATLSGMAAAKALARLLAR